MQEYPRMDMAAETLGAEVITEALQTTSDTFMP